MLLEGKQFSHYRILRLIGRGGMGEVYLAEDTQLTRQVAIKFIRIETQIPDQEAIARALRLFWREATAIASLDHANILPLLDHGEIMLDDFPLAYLVMPYRPEGSLTTWLRQREQDQQSRQLSLKQVEQLVQQAALALQYAHDHQIMHLDVKPANFLIRSRAINDEYPDLLLSDFGLARLASVTSSVSQSVGGTPTYMAPEHWANQPVFASDQYSLAIMAYELLTSHTPFRGAPMNVMYAHIHELPRSVCDFNSRLPTALDLILQRALAKKPDERYPSIAAFAQAFQLVPGQITLEMDKTATLLPPQPDSSNTVFGNRQFALPSVQPTSMSPLVDPLPHLTLPLQDSLSSLDVLKQTDLTAQNSGSSSKNLSTPTTHSTKNSHSHPKLQTTPTNSPLETLTISPLKTGTKPTRRRPRALVIGLLLLCLLILVGASIGAYSTITNKHPGQNSQKKTVRQEITSTTGAVATIALQKNKGSVTVTATSSATATAQKTSAPNSDHAYPTYLPGHGTFALFDPLSQTDYWHYQADSDTNGKCEFTGNALHAFEYSQGRTFHCDGPSFSDFAFEVQMTIIQGDCGGISFRYEIATHNFYQFDICLDLDHGEYYLFSVADNNYTTLKEDSVANLLSGLNHPILLAVVAQGNTIKLFINHQQITSTQDNTYTQGYLALTARDDQSQQTEVAYKNATVWTL